jgi:RNA polymerase sigma-70 factor (ECF subfamily)
MNPTQDIIIEQEEFAQYIQNLVSQMKPEHKNVIILRDMMQLSYEEIANVLDTSVGTVKSRLSRARNILRKKLNGREHFP